MPKEKSSQTVLNLYIQNLSYLYLKCTGQAQPVPGSSLEYHYDTKRMKVRNVHIF